MGTPKKLPLILGNRPIVIVVLAVGRSAFVALPKSEKAESILSTHIGFRVSYMVNWGFIGIMEATI